MKEHFQRLFQHANWADRRVLDVLRKQSPDNERARKLFCHVLAAERAWITRLGGQDSATIPIWPDLSFDDCASWLEQNAASYSQFLDDLTADGLDHVITYRNSKGAEFNTPVQEVLTHVALHGAGHRGQIAAALRDAGNEPANTDFITFVREVQ